MNRKTKIGILTLSVALAFPAGIALGRGGGGGGRGFGGGGARMGGMGGYGGGARMGGYGGGYGGARGGFGGYGGGGYGGVRSYGGGYSGSFGSGMSRTPSFSSPGAYGRAGSYGASTGGINYGSRSGSYTTQRGGTINYGAAGAGARGPNGGAAGRGVYGVSGTTAGGRSFADVGRAGGAVGPGGNAIGGRSNIGGVSGPNGTAIAGSRSGFVNGANGYHGASAYRPYGYNAYGGYHSGWVHGYWNGNYGNWGHYPYWGAWGLGLGMGAALGWGLSSWGYGSSLYGMGYMPYYNPYYVSAPAVVGQPLTTAYDYSQPIDTSAAPVAEQTANPAMALFDAGRASFHEGNYADALAKTDQALTTLPNDTTLHEFRALSLFALGRYDDAAATLYAVLAVGPGWDWTTLISLYPNVDVYTSQLRALEDYCNAHSDSATARFVLAYQYLTEGHNDAAATVLQQVVTLKPTDTLSAKLLKQLTPAAEATPGASDTPPPNPTPAVADTTVPAGATIAGTWTAKPTPDTTVTLSLPQPDGPFTWQVARGGKTQQFTGTSTFGDNVLTLAQDKGGPTMAGRVTWTDPTHITFRVSDSPDDKGLSFVK